MACVLTTGFSLDCRDGIGGIKEVYIIELANVSAITESSGICTAITKVTGKRFWKYSLVRETANATETGAGDIASGNLFYEQSVTIALAKRQATIRNEVMLLAKNNLTIVAVENTGKAFLYGRVYGLNLLAPVAETGVAWADKNGYTLPFVGKETELAPEVNTATVATLETPG